MRSAIFVVALAAACPAQNIVKDPYFCSGLKHWQTIGANVTTFQVSNCRPLEWWSTTTTAAPRGIEQTVDVPVHGGQVFRAVFMIGGGNSGVLDFSIAIGGFSTRYATETLLGPPLPRKFDAIVTLPPGNARIAITTQPAISYRDRAAVFHVSLAPAKAPLSVFPDPQPYRQQCVDATTLVPPGMTGFLFATTALLPRPIAIPGFDGPFWLDPRAGLLFVRAFPGGWTRNWFVDCRWQWSIPYLHFQMLGFDPTTGRGVVGSL